MSAAENLVLAGISLQFSNVTQQIRTQNLAPNERNFSSFNAGNDINKAICIDCKLGDNFCFLRH
jgi:hypothetical protein